ESGVVSRLRLKEVVFAGLILKSCLCESPPRLSIGARRIDLDDRPVMNEVVHIQSISNAGGVAARPSSEPDRAVPRAVVEQPGFFIALLAGKSVSSGDLRLAAHCLIGRGAVGRVFLVGNDLRILVQF